MTTESRAGGYENIYRALAARLAGFNLAENAPRLGLSWLGDGLELDFLNRRFRVDRAGVRQLAGAPAHVNHQSVLAGYAMSPGFGEPAFSFVPLSRLAGPLGGGAYEGAALHEPLAGRFQRDRTALRAALEALGARMAASPVARAQTWRFLVLPKIPVELAFHEGDEEFPPEARLRYDVTAPNFLDFEFLAVLAGLITAELIGY